MVFARTKLMMQDNCFEQDPGDVQLNYIGPNPQKLYKIIFDAIKTVFRAADSDIQEEDFTWGKKETEKFKARIYLHKDLDKFTHMLIRFDISGQGTEESGNATIKVKPVMRTEYPQDTVWQRSLFYEFLRTLWHNLFYHQKRVDYTEECRQYVIVFQRRMQQVFKKLNEKYG
ncbi:MAG: hypothetical protein KKB03_03070 [Nanoarchaeota archaeon]|nr:hypothetical protein [Nanoarchaeota archaeon]MBU1135387.1 hypothetical protein [Nanoarchaeota archaeon]MBU2520196.1 hypothetical protein [Nanoarchaeota archaeon]